MMRNFIKRFFKISINNVNLFTRLLDISPTAGTVRLHIALHFANKSTQNKIKSDV